MRNYKGLTHVEWSKDDEAFIKKKIKNGDEHAMWLALLNNVGYYLKCIQNEGDYSTEDIDRLHNAFPEIIKSLWSWGWSDDEVSLKSYVAMSARAAKNSKRTRSQRRYDGKHTSIEDDGDNLSSIPVEQCYRDVLIDEECRQCRNDRIHKAMKKLSKVDNSILYHYYWQQRTLKQVAERIGISYQAVNVRRKNALVSLRADLCERCV